jgi:MoaD family protein
MDVRIYATLRPIVGSSIVDVQTGPGATFKELVDELIARWPELYGEFFEGDGELRNGVHILLNGRDVRYIDGLATVIPAAAQVRIFPPVGGGSNSFYDISTALADQPIVSDYYGVPMWLMKEYLASLGGVEEAGDCMTGEGWQAALRKANPREIGSLRVGGTTAEFSGDPDALDAMFEKLHWKTLRGGG